MRRILITGGGRGIGAACVKKFTSNGDKVAFVYRNDDESAKSLCDKTGAFAIKADVSIAVEAERSVREAVEYLGKIDVLVSNAGISYISQICDTSNSDLEKIMNTNLLSAFVVAREVSRYMVREHYGRIINVGSVWGRCGASCEVAYSASKAGVRGLTMALAKELGPSGITVNCVEPGIINTDMNKCFDKETLREICDEIPAGRLGEAEEVAGFIEFLASDSASYINGQCIAIDGGWCI